MEKLITLISNSSVYSLFSFSFFIFFCTLSAPVFAQNTQTLFVDLAQSTQHREKILATSNQENLELCGLLIGQTYSLNYVSSEETNGGFLNQSTNVVKKLIFNAIGECSIFQLNKNSNSDITPIISIACDDCPSVTLPLSLSGNMMGVIGTPNLNADFLVQDVFIGGDCFETSGATIMGSPLSIGTFSGALPVFGFDDGIVLSTGYVSGTVGPSSIFNSNSTNGSNSDPDLESIATADINDVAILEFDFVPTVNQVSFEYVFASEEYCNFAPPNNSSVNDIFGFFLSGPGITGTINIAEVSAGVPVSINSVNPVTNAVFFNANGNSCSGGSGAGTELFGYDGFTDVFTAVANVTPCETYHIKLAIADGGDAVFDSAVFLKANNFEAGGAATISVSVPLTGSNDAYESDQCSNAFFTFTRESGDLLTPVIIEYTTGGTAINGVDYSGLPPSPFVIPSGISSLSFPISITPDDIPEGIETLTLYTAGQCSCENTETTLNIYDLLELDVNVPDVEICANFGTPVTMVANASGGLSSYFYDWGDGPSSINTYSDIPTGNTSYTVTVTDICGAEGTATGNVEVVNLYANLEGSASLCNGIENDILNISFSGSVGPFEIIYSIDGVVQSPIENILNNPYILSIDQAGTYLLEFVTIAGCIGEASGIVDVAGSSVELTSSFTNAICAGTNSGAIDLILINSNEEEISYLWSNESILEDQTNLPAGNYSVTVTSGGCDIIENFVLVENEPISVIANTQQIDCNSSAMGGIDITASGGNGTLSYNWSNGAITEDLTGLVAGTYSVTVTDIDNCTGTQTVTIDESGEFFINFSSSTIQDVSCEGYTDGSINLDIENSDELLFTWSENVAGQMGSLITDLAADTYLLTVTNAIGCSNYVEFEINEPLSFSYESEIQNASTGNSDDGNIFLEDTAGGTPPYTFLWSTGATTEDLQNVPVGEYSLSVTDAQFCVYNFNFEVDATVATLNILDARIEFFLHPNLVQGGVRPVLFINSLEADILDFQVITVSGQVLIEEQKRLEQGDNEVEIEISTLPAGVYFLQLGLESTDYSVVKFVVF